MHGRTTDSFVMTQKILGTERMTFDRGNIRTHTPREYVQLDFKVGGSTLLGHEP